MLQQALLLKQKRQAIKREFFTAIFFSLGVCGIFLMMYFINISVSGKNENLPVNKSKTATSENSNKSSKGGKEETMSPAHIRLPYFIQ